MGRSARESLRESHTPEAIRRRLAAPRRVSYLGDWVYGGIDGTVTIFALTAGCLGADLAPQAVAIRKRQPVDAHPHDASLLTDCIGGRSSA